MDVSIVKKQQLSLVIRIYVPENRNHNPMLSSSSSSSTWRRRWCSVFFSSIPSKRRYCLFICVLVVVSLVWPDHYNLSSHHHHRHRRQLFIIGLFAVLHAEWYGCSCQFVCDCNVAYICLDVAAPLFEVFGTRTMNATVIVLDIILIVLMKKVFGVAQPCHFAMWRAHRPQLSCIVHTTASYGDTTTTNDVMRGSECVEVNYSSARSQTHITGLRLLCYCYCHHADRTLHLIVCMCNDAIIHILPSHRWFMIYDVRKYEWWWFLFANFCWQIIEKRRIWYVDYILFYREIHLKFGTHAIILYM